MNARTWTTLLASLALLAPTTARAHAPTKVFGPAAATAYPEAFPVHGVGGDEVLLFALQPTDVPGHDRGVWASRRLDGKHLGALPVPQGGWGAPVAMKVVTYQSTGLLRTEGTMLVLDAFTPQQAGTRPGIVYEYSYSYSVQHGFAAALLGTHPLPMLTGLDAFGVPNGPGYPISLALLPNGAVVVIDMLFGTIWVSPAGLDNWRLAVVDPRFQVGQLLAPIDGVGRAPGGGTRPYTFSTVSIPPMFPFPILPGIHGVAYVNPTDEVAVIRTATPGGIYGIPASVVLDQGTPPFAKGARVREIVAPQPGVSDLSVGLDYDRFHPNTPWLYWQRSVANARDGYNTIYRVDVNTGVVEKLVESVAFYDWTNEISVLPSHLGPHFTVLTNANMQEENVPESNALLNGVATLVGPTIIPIAAFSNW